MQGQKGLFVKKNSIKLGEIICPFAGTYSDKDADFQKEQYYSFATSMENCVISPSASQQAGFSANTALKLTQDGDIYYNKDGYPEYDTNHINAYFIEKYATFKNENDEKKIIPLIFILYVGSDKVHKKDGDIEIRVNYGPDYLKSMANKTNTQRPHKKQKLDTTILSSHIGFSDKITPKKQKTTTLMKKTWEENFANLSEYKNKHNRFRDLSKTDQNLYRFYLSSIKQLQKYSSGENVELKEDQINKLKGIGLNEEQILKTKTWEERFASLAKYKKDNDGFQGLRRIDKNLYEFYRISIKILEKHDNNESVTLTLDQINKLKGIGINKEQILKTKTWEENFAYLSEYKRKHNGFKDLLKIRDLYYFFLKNKRLLDQHTAGQGVKLTQKQIDKLKEIGLDKIEIKSPKKTWEENFAYLSEYKRKHNGFKDLRKTDQNLYSFYKNSIKLLQKYNSGVKVELKEDQIDKLKEIGLDKIKLMEKQKSRTWEESFASLIEYKKKHNGFQGLSNIDKRLYDFYSKHKKLLNEHNNGEKVKLTPDQIKKLQELFLGDSS